ncbi:MAG TPA: peptide deformylase [Vicinamibacteria bacterium]|nr:peptide deformylase [Vicinamibacteria bacterium]
MAILKVARIGHPAVRAGARDLSGAEIGSAEIQRLIDDMVETMHEYDGVGLAAPQVHVALRLAVIEVPAHDERAEDEVPLTVLANPRVTLLGSDTLSGFEGCLSIPGLRGEVPRHARLRLEALDRQGKPYAIEAEGFFARVIQHECDHLEGDVYLDRMHGMRSLSFIEEFEKHRRGSGEE